MKKAILTVVLALALSGSAQAFPGLIVYIPGADYDATTNSWVTYSNDFDVWVLSTEDISNLNLTASTEVGASYTGSLAVDGFGYSDTDFMSGSPTTFGRRTTGIGSYLTHNVGSINRWQPKSFRINLSGDGVLSLDFWGYDGNDYLQHSIPRVMARVGSAVPEPASMLLFGIGLGAVALRRRRKAKMRNAVV